MKYGEKIQLLSPKGTLNTLTYVCIRNYKETSQNELMNRNAKEATTRFSLPYIPISIYRLY